MQIASKQRRVPATLRLGAGYAESSSPESATVIDPIPAMEEEETLRNHIPEYRTPLNGRRSALESTSRKFGDRKTEYVVAPEKGMEFDSLPEVHDFYNLYSWELGFGTRYGQQN